MDFFFFCPHSCTPSLKFFPPFTALFACKKCKAALTWFTFFFLSSPCVGGKRFNIHGCSEPPLGIVTTFKMSIYEPFLLHGAAPLCFFLLSCLFFFLSGLMDRGAKWAVFLLFQQRGHLYSIPGSQVSYSAPLQVMSGP